MEGRWRGSGCKGGDRGGGGKKDRGEDGRVERRMGGMEKQNNKGMEEEGGTEEGKEESSITDDPEGQLQCL